MMQTEKKENIAHGMWWTTDAGSDIEYRKRPWQQYDYADMHNRITSQYSEYSILRDA